jgi:hypothetical protein
MGSTKRNHQTIADLALIKKLLDPTFLNKRKEQNDQEVLNNNISKDEKKKIGTVHSHKMSLRFIQT